MIITYIFSCLIINRRLPPNRVLQRCAAPDIEEQKRKLEMRPRWSPTPPGGPLSRPDGSPTLPTCGSGEERGSDASAFPSSVFVLLHPPRRNLGVLSCCTLIAHIYLLTRA